MFESKSGVLLIAGLGFFALAFLSNGLVPWLLYANMPEKTVEQTIEEQINDPKRTVTVLSYFKDLRKRYPEAMAKHYGIAADRKEFELKDEELVAPCSEALRLGRKVYTGEACWHCHSQFIRPVSNEDRRWGRVSSSKEYQNELQRPVMFGTRRIGPDLIREGGRRANDWHVVHFFKPKLTSPESVMPDYPWLFDGNTPDGPGEPNKRGIALILYMQWLGSWLDEYPHYVEPRPDRRREDQP